MAHRLRGALLATALVLSAPASATSFSDAYFLGDSVSDTGNAATAILALGGSLVPAPFGGIVPPAPYALSGRFSNGPIWAEQFAAGLGLSATASLLGGTGLAFGGADSGPLPGVPAGLSPTLRDQADAFLGALPPAGADPDALYVVWAAGNDIRRAAAAPDPAAVVAASVANVAGIITDLQARGAESFLVPNLGNVGRTPEAQRAGAAAAAGAAALSAAYNDALALALADLSALLPVDLFTLDVFSLIEAIVADPLAFGLTNVTDPCVDVASVCANPDEYLFWDGIHPTTVAHGIIAGAARAAIPAPATLWLLAAGLAGLARTRRRPARLRRRQRPCSTRDASIPPAAVGSALPPAPPAQTSRTRLRATISYHPGESRSSRTAHR